MSARTEVRYHFNLTQTVSEKNDMRVSLKTNQTNKQNKTNKNKTKEELYGDYEFIPYDILFNRILVYISQRA